MQVTFVAGSFVDRLEFPEDTYIGAQYDIDRGEGLGAVYAVIWRAPIDGSEALVRDSLFAGSITVDWNEALPTLSEVFGLHVPCFTGQPQG